MANQVRAEAVFDTSTAVASADAYTNAINRAMAAQDGLSAAIQRTITGLQAQATSFAGVTAAAQGTVNTFNVAIQTNNSLSQSYSQIATQANAAIQNMRAANTLRNSSAAQQQPASGQQNQNSGFGAGTAVAGYLSYETIKNITDSLIKASDAWIDLGGRIKIATGEAGNFAYMQQQLFDLAQKDRVAYSGVADQFSRIMVAGHEMNITTEQAMALTTVLTDIGRASHRSAGEIASVNIEVSHLIANGVVQARQLTPLFMAFPQLIQIIQANWQNLDGTFGLSHAKMVALMRDGQLESSKFLNALLRGQQQAADLASQAPTTVTQALTQLENAWTKTVGDMSKQTGFTDSLVAAVQNVIRAVTSPAGLGLIKVVMDSISSSISTLVEWLTMEKLLTAINTIVATIIEAWRQTKEFAGAIVYLTAGFKSFFEWYAKINADVAKIQGYLGGKPLLPDMTQTAASAAAAAAATTALADALRKAGEESAAAARLRGPIKDEVPPIQDIEVYNRRLEDRKKHLEEILKASQDQLAVERIRAKLSGDDLVTALAKLDVERLVTADDRKNFPDLVARIAIDKEQYELAKKRVSDNAFSAQNNEKIKLLNTQIAQQEALATGDQRLIDDANMQVKLERLITDKMLERDPVQRNLMIQGEKALEVATRAAKQAHEWTALYKNMGDTLVNSFMEAGKQGKSFSDALKSTLPVLAEMIVKALVLQPIVNSFSGMFGNNTQKGLGTSASTFWSELIRGKSGSIADPSGSGWNTTYSGGGLFSANGNAFIGGHVQAFANGGLVDRPTMFGHAGGVGMMAEAGTEAIMPLTRLGNGKLGVHAGGGGDTNTYHINLGVAGDLTDATKSDLLMQMDMIMKKNSPGIVKASVNAVQSANRSNPNFLRR